MYIYVNHLGGGLYAEDHALDYEKLYCETCGDADTFLGQADSGGELLELLEGEIDINGSGGWDPEYIKRFIRETFDAED